MSLVALSELLGATVRDATGAVRGRVREIAIAPQDHPTRIAFLIVRTPDGERVLPRRRIKSAGATVRAATDAAQLGARHAVGRPAAPQARPPRSADHRRPRPQGRARQRRRARIDAGQQPPAAERRSRRCRRPRRRPAAVEGRRPSFTLRALLERIPPRVIPWQFVDLLETDPARRVKLKIAYEGLAKLHPADIADIVEDLAPAEREAVFETIDEEVAAEALEEIDPDIQVSIVESLDKDRAADIVEEMDPDAAADLLGDLTEEHSGEILKEMEPEERQEVTQLLEFGEHTAAGRMTTEFIAVPETAVRRRCHRGAEGVRGQRRSASRPST